VIGGEQFTWTQDAQTVDLADMRASGGSGTINALTLSGLTRRDSLRVAVIGGRRGSFDKAV